MHERIETRAIEAPGCRSTPDDPIAPALSGACIGVDQAQPGAQARATEAIREFAIVGGLLEPIGVSGLEEFPLHRPGQVAT